MRLLVNRWSPVTHASHCMITSRLAAATQMRTVVSPAIQPEAFLCQMPFPQQPSYFPAREWLNAGLHVLRLYIWS